MASPTNGALAGPASVNHYQNDNRKATAQPTGIPDNQEPKPQNSDGDPAAESRAESDTVHSGATPEAPSSNENNIAAQTTEANTAQSKPSDDGKKNGDGDNNTPPATKEKKRRNRASPKKDSEDSFRVFMGMLPHSRNTEPVTDEMRKKLAADYESLYPRYQMEFGQCLHSSIPDSVKVSWLAPHKGDVIYDLDELTLI